MTADLLPGGVLEDLSALVAGQLGLHFPPDRDRDLNRAAVAASLEVGFSSPETFVASALRGDLAPADWEIFVDHLTIGETYFLRDEALFAELERSVLPDLGGFRDGLLHTPRIWCAGCATGEEPYSVAMILLRALGERTLQEPPVLATDINNRFLEKARRGEYGRWSFRRAPPWVREDHFQDAGEGRLRISHRLREMVTFQRLNLVDGNYPSPDTGTMGMDIILCRNVLMYFERETRDRVFRSLASSLREGGWLFVSPSEVTHVSHPSVRKIRLGSLFGFRREGSTAPAVSPLEPPTPVQKVRSAPRKARHRTPVKPARPTETHKPWEVTMREAAAFFEEGEYRDVVRLLGSRAEAEGEARGWRTLPRALPALMARAHANLGELEEAGAWCERALSLDETSPGPYLLLAGIRQEQGDEEASLASLRRALYLDPDSVIARFRMGMACRRAGRMPEAERWLVGVLELLETMDPGQVLPDSEGLTAEELTQVSNALLAEVES